MEVETQSFSSFDGPAFSFSIEIGADHPELRSSRPSSEMSVSAVAPEDQGLHLPAKGGGDQLGSSDLDLVTDGGMGNPGACSPAGELVSPHEKAAMKVQKFYRSYRTRRLLADRAVEELWWQAINFARLNHSTISFFDSFNPETAASRWHRVGLNASKVGQGLFKDDKAQKLAFQHWIEAIDPRHRYGHFLHLYYEEWVKADADQPFFYWLDIGGGKEVDLKECPRSKLRKQCIKYLGPQEREHYEYIVVQGTIVHKWTGNLLDTQKESPKAKWIFVMSTAKKFYAAEKKKGAFHHSSFLAGGASVASGRLVVEDGTFKLISPHSGHYRPTEDSFESFLSFLKENGVDLEAVEIHKADEDYEFYEDGKSSSNVNTAEASRNSDGPDIPIPIEMKTDLSLEPSGVPPTESKNNYQGSLCGDLQSPRAQVIKAAILQRINSKKAAKSYQLGHQLSRKWSSGAGPRICCIADYPVELRLQALEFTNLSPRSSSTSSTPRGTSGFTSPAASPSTDL